MFRHDKFRTCTALAVWHASLEAGRRSAGLEENCTMRNDQTINGAVSANVCLRL